MEKEINEIVFKVYEGILKKDEAKRVPIINRIGLLFRYIISGTLLKKSYVYQQLLKVNKFNEVKAKYTNYKYVVYTVVAGSYDEVKEPIYINPNIDYYIFTDNHIPSDSMWKKIPISSIDSIKNYSFLEQARYIKTHPQEFFEDYDYSMFIDGNIQITCDIMPLFNTVIANNKSIAIHRHQSRQCLYDEAKYVYVLKKAKLKEIKKQIKAYKKQGFPQKYGLFETNVIIRKHNEKICINVMEEWWNEIIKFTKRDQLSFTYALWKNNLDSDYVLSLGNNSRRNPYFIVYNHK